MNSRPFRCFALLLLALLLSAAVRIPSALAEAECRLTVYFPNWNVYSGGRNEVKDLPWDRLDCVNHAFWKIVPRDGGFAIASTDPWADTDPANPKAHFPQYAEYAGKYPDTKILLSIGGWTACGYFSEMALTQESRASFIQSCLDTLEAYPFLAGLDIDWEYPGVARAGGDGDEGNPVKGDDKTNYTLLLAELRAALDERFGPGGRLLTVCAGSSGSTLPKQDYAALYPYVDRVNLMTYDMAGSWNAFTGHHTALFGKSSVEAAVKYLLTQGVPAGKIAIGSPLYSHGWTMQKSGDTVVGAAAKSLAGGDLTWRELQPLEQAAVPEGEPGWHMGYDEQAEAAYLWNDDPSSGDYLVFYTYESARSLAAKLAYISERGLGGLIVWQVHGDGADMDWPMITQMYRGLHP
ncbi:MAG: hypothetical protein J5998_01265 [Clostridia bacterium]|nr:hypothetical protein [Clostridia bacterium]